MRKFIKYRWVLLVHVLLMIIAYNTRLILPQDLADKLYFKLIAFAWCIPPIFLLWCFQKSKALDILLVFSFFSLNNLLDELFFDPSKLGWNEIAFAIITITSILSHKCKSNIKKYGMK